MSTYNKEYYKEHCAELKQKQKGYYATHREERKSYSKNYSKTHQDQIKDYLQSRDTKWRVYQLEARKRDLPWCLSKEEFDTLFDLPCHYHGGEEPSRGIDRVDNCTGYTTSNCVPCCYTCNMMKRGLGLEDFFNRIRLIASRFPQTEGW